MIKWGIERSELRISEVADFGLHNPVGSFRDTSSVRSDECEVDLLPLPVPSDSAEEINIRKAIRVGCTREHVRAKFPRYLRLAGIHAWTWLSVLWCNVMQL